MAPTLICQNGEVFNCSIRGVATGNGYVFRDVSAFQNTKDWNIGILTPDIENCADSDGSLTTGINNVQEINPSSEYWSLDDNSVRFLKIRYDSSLLGTGRSVDDNEYDIAGLPRPGPAGNCIGSHELSAEEINDELDIRAVPSEGLNPLGVQFTNVDAEEE